MTKLLRSYILADSSQMMLDEIEARLGLSWTASIEAGARRLAELAAAEMELPGSPPDSIERGPHMPQSLRLSARAVELIDAIAGARAETRTATVGRAIAAFHSMLAEAPQPVKPKKGRKRG